MNRTLFAHGDWDPVIFLALLVLVAIVVGCIFVIAMSWWLTAKVRGSTGLFWGSLLGVGTVYVVPRAFGWFFGYGHELLSLLLNATAASALVCVVNLMVWVRKRRRKLHGDQNGAGTDVSPNQSLNPTGNRPAS
jgi:hypothetical protein